MARAIPCCFHHQNAKLRFRCDQPGCQVPAAGGYREVRHVPLEQSRKVLLLRMRHKIITHSSLASHAAHMLRIYFMNGEHHVTQFPNSWTLKQDVYVLLSARIKVAANKKGIYCTVVRALASISSAFRADRVVSLEEIANHTEPVNGSSHFSFAAGFFQFKSSGLRRA